VVTALIYAESRFQFLIGRVKIVVFLFLLAFVFVFQFLIGRVKIDNRRTGRRAAKKFQFLIGRVKISPVSQAINGSGIGFNSL